MAVSCSQCGIEKREVNHWWLAWSERRGTRFCFVPFELDPAMQRETTVQKICGEACLVKAVVKHAETLRLMQ